MELEEESLDQAKIVPLKEWFIKHRRSLPWRENHTPYRVWVSEVMLQQTQVSVVIPYFKRWMERFPSVEALARASIEDVIKAWEGLGYYSRARNLHAGAQYVCERYGGSLPKSKEELLTIKGLGSYTAGAIAAFAYGQKEVAVDGNVRRVLARLYALEGSIDSTRVQREIEALAVGLLPDEEPWLVVEGLIELGALVCQKVPHCFDCPLSSQCKAYEMGAEKQLPIRRKRAKSTALHRFVYVVKHESAVMVRKESEGVMQDLWHFPFIEMGSADFEQQRIRQDIEGRLGGTLLLLKELERIKHGFTRYQAHLYPHIWELEALDRPSINDYEWVALQELGELPFCSGHREICHKLLEIS